MDCTEYKKYCADLLQKSRDEKKGKIEAALKDKFSSGEVYYDNGHPHFRVCEYSFKIVDTGGGCYLTPENFFMLIWDETDLARYFEASSKSKE